MGNLTAICHPFSHLIPFFVSSTQSSSHQYLSLLGSALFFFWILTKKDHIQKFNGGGGGDGYQELSLLL